MKVIKTINNNVALCIDAKGNEVIVFGKGVGFNTEKKEIELNRIERTFYHLDNQYINMLNDIPFDVYRIAENVIDYASGRLLCELNGNLLFNLADHINYSIERFKKGIVFNFPVTNDVEHLFEAEMDVGRYALAMIEEEYGIRLPEDEAAFIALNILNSEYNPLKKSVEMNDIMIHEITRIIETHFNMKIDQKSFNYSRFVSHMYYLFKREPNKESDPDNNQVLFETMMASYPHSYACMTKVKKYIEKEKGWTLSQDECLYLMLHINRLCTTQINKSSM